MRKWIVAGANGQVGAELCLLLASEADLTLVPVCRTRSGSAFLRAQGIAVRHGSVANPEQARTLLGDGDVIVNSALATGTPRQIRATEDAIIENILATAPAGAQVIHFSTQSVYGDPRPGRMIRWRNPYGRAKLGTERSARRAARRYGKSLYILRLGHVGGALQGISEQVRATLAAGEAVLPAREVASNLVYTVTIVDAIRRIARGDVTPGTYDLMSSPQLGWRQVYEIERVVGGLPDAPIAVAAATEPSGAGGPLRAAVRLMLGAQARSALAKLLAHAPERLNARANAWWHRQRARGEIAALARRPGTAEHLSWVANGSNWLPGLTPTLELLASQPYRDLLHTGRRPWPQDLPLASVSDTARAGVSSVPRPESDCVRPLRLAIVTTHPVQYYSPVFRGLARLPNLRPRVFFTWSQSEQGDIVDAGFGKSIRWDVPLLEGFEHEFVPNTSARPGLHGFLGIRTPTLAARIADFGADALLVYGWNLFAHLAVMRAFKGRIPVYFRGDSTLLDPQPAWRRTLRRLALASVYRYVDVAIAVGSNSRDYYRWCGLADGDIEFAPHSVDVARFAEDGPRREAVARQRRAELGIPADALVFGFAGKFLPKKDPLLLVDAFLAAHPGAYLLLFGSGPLDDRLRALAARHQAIHVLPFQNQSEMPVAYRMTDVFVLPSRGPGETWGLVLNEAMACGRAVIASSRVGGARDLITTGDTGWTFPAGDVRALSAVFNQVASLPRPELRALGERARQLAQRFSTEECVTRMAEVITRRSA